MYVEAVSDEKNRSLIEYTKALVCRFFSNPYYVNHQRHVTRMPQKNQRQLPPLSKTNHNTQPVTEKKHRHHDPPRSPASSGSNF